jgi:subtilisin family serine protease
MKPQNLSIENLEPRKMLSTVPNDPMINSQWALKDSNIYEAWTYGTGSKNVVVAVIDSGIDVFHNDLKGNLWVNPKEIANNGIDDDKNGYVDDIYGWNFHNNNNNLKDDYGHGTHVAGIIGAKGNNGVGTVGVNWNVSIMSLKYYGGGSYGSVDNTIRAIDYATMMRSKFGVNIVAINASWGGIPYHKGLHDSINRAGNAGIVFVASAGNSSMNNDISPRFPSSYDSSNLIAVASSQQNGSLSSFSNYGKNSVDLAAQGSSILSTKPLNKYAYMSGTSMATPMVTGTVALLKSINSSLTVSNIKDIVLKSVDFVGALLNKVLVNGKLNIGKAALLAKNTLPVGQAKVVLDTIYGWAIDNNSKTKPVVVEIWVNDKLQSVVVSNQRVDVYKSNAGFIVKLNLNQLNNKVTIRARDNESSSSTIIFSGNVKVSWPRINFAAYAMGVSNNKK